MIAEVLELNDESWSNRTDTASNYKGKKRKKTNK
jgi:hypothetical protein